MKTAMFLAFLACGGSGWSQTGSMIIQAKAYAKTVAPAIAEPDENGAQKSKFPRVVYTVFFETRQPAPVWTSAWAGTTPLQLTLLPFDSDSIEVGRAKHTGEKILFRIKHGHAGQVLELAANDFLQPSGKTAAPKALLLKGRRKGRTFFYKISAFTELSNADAVRIDLKQNAAGFYSSRSQKLD